MSQNNNNEEVGPNCTYQPKLRHLPYSELKQKHAAAKRQYQLLAEEMRYRSYQAEKRNK